MNLRVLVLVPLAGAAHADGPSFVVGAVGGASIQSDQYILGAHAGYHGVGLSFLDVELVAVAGLGADTMSVRPAVHLRTRLEVEGFRVAPIVGASIYSYWPRGDFATFCEKANLPCWDTVAGFDLGLGIGYRWFGLDFVFGTGELPLYTFAGTVTFRL